MPTTADDPDPVTKQAQLLHISRGSVYYRPRPVPEADLAIMRRLDRLHLEFPFAGSRMLRGLLVAEGCKIDRHRLAPRDCGDDLFLDLLLQIVDLVVRRDDTMGKGGVSPRPGVDRVRDLLAIKTTHFHDFVGKLVQIGVKGTGGMVDHDDPPHVRLGSSVRAIAPDQARVPRRPGAQRVGQGFGASRRAELPSSGRRFLGGDIIGVPQFPDAPQSVVAPSIEPDLRELVSDDV